MTANPDAPRAALTAAQPACTCPSGDGSLRHPCPSHPPSPPTGEGRECPEHGKAAVESLTLYGCGCSVHESEGAGNRISLETATPPAPAAEGVMADWRRIVRWDVDDDDTRAMVTDSHNLGPYVLYADAARIVSALAALAQSPQAVGEPVAFRYKPSGPNNWSAWIDVATCGGVPDYPPSVVVEYAYLHPAPSGPSVAAVTDEEVEIVGSRLYVYWSAVSESCRGKYRDKVRAALIAAWDRT